jgi:hydrophobic/amphiphilic exporter-1 (mainly G- bacteria), HAE1 family
VIGGVITSSLLTLVVVPVAYTVLDDFGAWVTRKWRRGAKGKTLTAPPERSRDIAAEVDRVP